MVLSFHHLIRNIWIFSWSVWNRF